MRFSSLLLALLLPAGLNAKEPDPAILAMKAGVKEGKASLPWRLFIPEGTSDTKFPLVVALHGAGSRGEDNVRPMALFAPFWSPDIQKKYPAFVLAPQMKRSWITYNGKFTNFSTDEHPASESLLAMIELVEAIVKEYPIDPNRIYLIGASMGGYGTWDAMTRRPDLWAAAVPICGGGDPTKADTFKHIPIWAWHGSKDGTVPPETTRTIIEALKTAGANPQYSEPETGHHSWKDAFASPELYEWMFNQRKP